jgi:crossover junction endodeoxyribonuclease RuvC
VRLIGIDPGTHIIGWGIVDLPSKRPVFVACGALVAPDGEGVPMRLAFLADRLAEVIRDQHPDVAAVEKAFFGKNANAALRVGEARGVALAELARAEVEVHELTPAEVKRAVTGSGAARKPQVQRMVAALLECRTLPEPADASDALALALCLAHRISFLRSSGARRKGP